MDVSSRRGREKDFFGKKKSEGIAGVTSWKCICKKAADLLRQIRCVVSADKAAKRTLGGRDDEVPDIRFEFSSSCS